MKKNIIAVVLFCFVFLFLLILNTKSASQDIYDPERILGDPLEDVTIIGDEEQEIRIGDFKYNIRNAKIRSNEDGKIRMIFSGGENSYLMLNDDFRGFVGSMPLDDLNFFKEGESNEIVLDGDGRIIEASFSVSRESYFGIENINFHLSEGSRIEYSESEQKIKVKIPDDGSFFLPEYVLKDADEEFIPFMLEVESFDEDGEFSMILDNFISPEMSELIVKGKIYYRFGDNRNKDSFDLFYAYDEISIDGMNLKSSGIFYLNFNNPDVDRALGRVVDSNQIYPRGVPVIYLSETILGQRSSEAVFNDDPYPTRQDEYQVGRSLRVFNPREETISLDIPPSYFGYNINLDVGNSHSGGEFSVSERTDLNRELFGLTIFAEGNNRFVIDNTRYDTFFNEGGKTELHYPLNQPFKQDDDATRIIVIPKTVTIKSYGQKLYNPRETTLRTFFGESFEFTPPRNPEHEEKRGRYLDPYESLRSRLGDAP